ncbi:MAG: NAD-dependent epimerase/dehydratase family protein [Alphaproteobacteria bacterium]|nr:NAD-dependent epimerase/dehydratase family protein [Alphaproteobacteria bacterium]
MSKRILVTGAAGFIGFHASKALLERGHSVIGVDNLNDYYAPSLKRARLDRLAGPPGFQFREMDIADHERLAALPEARDVDVIIHLAAQAGVRYSLENPFAYASSNLVGHLSVLELARRAPKRPLLVYASSSSVYGANTKVPYRETDPVEQPVSLYAATKRADELMSESYARLYGLASIGLRFFTVYGPWGRPDMAYWLFAEKMLAREPIRVFNNGDLERDFTYIDDITDGVLAVALNAPKFSGPAPHRIYNIGNNRPVDLMRFIAVLEQAIGEKAVMHFEPMQPGDVYATYADIDAIKGDYGFEPKTPLEVGIPKFVDWYKAYRGERR